MHMAQLLSLAADLAAPLQALDDALVELRPGALDAAPPWHDLKGACTELQHSAQAVAAAMQTLDERDAGPGGLRGADLQLAAGTIAVAVQRLIGSYRGIAHQSLRAGRPPAHERLTDCARDGLVTLAHGLAGLIQRSLALAETALASGASAEFEFSLRLDAPDDELALAAWVPARLAYARDTVTRALQDAQGSARRASVAVQPTFGGRPGAARTLAASARGPSLWSGVSSFVLALLVFDALSGSD